jgi:cytochrome c
MLGALGCLVAVAAPAAASEAIIKKARCVACHAIDKKLVGPAYKDVAAKYRDQAEAPAKLFTKVRQGGAGVWGEIPMTPNPADKISDDDLKAAIAWILELK